MYKINKKIGSPLYVTDLDEMKENANCPDSEKTGSGPGSCGGTSGKDQLNKSMNDDFKKGIKQIEKAKFGTDKPVVGSRTAYDKASSAGKETAAKYLKMDLDDPTLTAKEIRANIIPEVIHTAHQRVAKDVPYQHFADGFMAEADRLIKERTTKMTPSKKKK